MKKILLFLLIAFILLFITSCGKSEFSCPSCEYFDFNVGECKESVCCSNQDCDQNMKCFSPATEFAACIDKDDCSDTLEDSSCSIEKPIFCNNGKISDRCDICDCENGFNCVNNSCEKIIYPIILVHGFNADGIAWRTFKTWLEEDNFTTFAPDFVPPDGDINLLSAELDFEINKILNETGSEYVDIVAHSMGGVVTRNYLNKIDNAPVEKVVFIGTPHKGSSLSWYFGGDSLAAQQLRFESEFIKELNSYPLRGGIEYLNIIGNKFSRAGIEYDSLILTREAYLNNVTNYYFKEDHFDLIKRFNIYEDVKEFLLS